MYKSKKEVDTHVRASLSKLRSETERNLRGFTIAKLYYKINEYATAEQYLEQYISVKDDNEQAHKLLGQCYQHMKKAEKALQSFQRSLQINPKQKDTLVEVCKLLLEEKNFNNKAQYWCDLAESENVQDDAVFSLRLRIMNKQNLETDQIEGLIQKEISSRPNDIQLRVRLVRNYIDQNKMLDAFKYVYDLEMSQNDAFTVSGEWYNTVWLVLNKYEQMPNVKKGWDFWLLLNICLERQVSISFTMTSSSITNSLTETTNLLSTMDQYLYKVSQITEKLNVSKEMLQLFLDHYRGQFLLYVAALLFKRESTQNKNRWSETVKNALPLLLLAFHIDIRENKEPWMKHCNEQETQLIQMWQREGAFRCAQVGRILLSCIADHVNKNNGSSSINSIASSEGTLWQSGEELLAQVRQTCSDKQWRRHLFNVLFCSSDQRMKEQTSLLIQSSKMDELTYELPVYAEVERYEEIGQYLKPQSLQHMVYLCLGNEHLDHVRIKYFSGLSFSTQNLSFCGPESVNQLDIETFLFASTIQAKRNLEVEREAFDMYNSKNRNAIGKPRILPFVNLQEHLCTEEQANWWFAAHQVYKNLSVNNFAEMRAILQYGIEAVRGINGPKMDIIIAFQLGKIFVERSKDVVKPVEKAFLEARVENLYKYGLNMYKMNNKNVLEPYRKYFKYLKSNSSAVEREMASAAEDAISYLADRYFRKAEYEELIDEMSGIDLPFATFFQAEAYRKLDETNKTPMKNRRIYLDRANELLNKTMTLLRNTQTDSNHPLNAIISGEMKRYQQSFAKFVNDNNYSPLNHNNSSTYEDAEENLFQDMTTNSGNFHHRRIRDNSAALINSPHNTEMELLVKQMAKTLSLLKEEIVDAIKPEVQTMRMEISSLKDKIATLEDCMKKTHISSNPPSRDEAGTVLDDLYMIDDALQNQIYQHNQQTPASAQQNMFSNTTNSPSQFMQSHQQQQHQQHQQQQQQHQQQQRINTSSAMHMHPNHAAVAAAAYNSSMFNPNTMNYYTPSYMMGAPGPGPAAMGMLGQRNPLQMPFVDSGFNLMQQVPAPTPTPLLPHLNTDSRSSNLYGLLSQQPSGQSNLPQLSMPMTLGQMGTSIPTIAVGSTAPQAVSSASPFNKTLNNQPVEKEPPANVVITTSDPLPNPNTISLQAQTPMLSVKIPPQHIKPSVVQTPEPVTPPVAANAPTAIPAVSTPFGAAFNLPVGSLSNTMFTSFGNSPFSISAATITSKSTTTQPMLTSTAATTSMTSTFSFKPQIELAKQQSEANAANDDALNKTDDSVSSAANRSETEVEYDPRPDFKPIIPLPDEVDVKTGEEDEEVVFCQRAKLFRHIDNEWKERGIGNMKILKNKDGYSRVLMRREQTHKVCANHKITSDLKITQAKNENKAYIWGANDFADEELKRETFLVRFKLPETAQDFFHAFQKAQKEEVELSKRRLTENSSDQSKSINTNPSKPFALAKSNVSNFATSTPAGKTENNTPKPALLSNETTAATVIGTPTTTTTTIPASSVAVGVAAKSLFGGLNLGAASIDKTPDAVNLSSKTDAGAEIASPFANFTFDKHQAGGQSTASTPFANIFSTNVTSFSLTTTPPVTTQAGIHTDVANKSHASDAEDDYVPTAQFNPVIPLPELVEVTTGEENEIVLFEHRAKLLRFDKATGEWKERGLGNIRLLQDKDDKNKVRLVMRREQVHKLCCNQRLYKDTSFKYVMNSKTALCWAGQDFSENELITEMLTIRFKTQETCKQFYDAILKAQSNMTGDAIESVAKEEYNNKKKEGNAAKEEQKTEEKPKGFGNAFKPKPGSWSCEACYITNKPENLYCVACDSPKDSTVPKKPQANVFSSTTPSSFSFGFSGGNTSSAAATSLTETKPAFSFGFSTTNMERTLGENSGSAPTKFNFGFGAGTGKTVDGKVEKPAVDGGFSFGTLTATKSEPPKSLFGSLMNGATTEVSKSFPLPVTTAAEESASSTSSISKPTFTFSLPTKCAEVSFNATPTVTSNTEATQNFSLTKKEFCFTLKPKSPGKDKNKSPGKHTEGDGGAEDDDGDYEDDEENNTYFTPVIPLPDKIEVKTGEENEEPLYVHRAKLYRFSDGEWKERGVGDVKILRHKESKKLRVVMRRDQVLKICLNHVLNETVEYHAKDEKTWLFVVNDFSEGQVELEKFSLRFKTKEIANGFLEAVKSALAGTAIPIETVQTTPGSHLAFQKAMQNISEEEKELADKLKLPYDFFINETPCTGCRGCDPDNFNFAQINITSAFVSVDDIENPLKPLHMPELTLPKTNRSILKQSALSTSLLSKSTLSESSNSPNVQKDPENLFSGLQLKYNFGDSSVKSASTFSFTDAFNSTNNTDDSKPGSGGFLFGHPANDTNTNSTLFGDKTIFDQQSSIFGSSTTKSVTTTVAETTSTTTSASVFGGKSTTTTSIFGNQQSCVGTASIFGGGLTRPQMPKSIFGTAAMPSGGSLFGSTNTDNKSSPVASTNNTFTSSAMPAFADLSAKAGGLDFASLAAKVKNDSTTGFNKEPAQGGFIGLTNQDAFSSFSKTNSEKGNLSATTTTDSNANDSLINKSNNENPANDENYDPYYEPIIALPNEIIATTGEEEETKLFGERAVLFRWDDTNKEWKERGVGELKILLHPTKKKYRLLMRREQIHKLVLNHSVGAQFSFKNMGNNPKSFLWAAKNYVESNEGTWERLAVRFSKEDTAKEFSRILNECIETAKLHATESEA